jgi:hypothetical protein
MLSIFTVRPSSLPAGLRRDKLYLKYREGLEMAGLLARKETQHFEILAGLSNTLTSITNDLSIRQHRLRRRYPTVKNEDPAAAGLPTRFGDSRNQSLGSALPKSNSG